LSNEAITRLAIGVVAFAIGALSMEPPSGVLFNTIHPDGYVRWVCPHSDDAICKRIGLTGPERILKP